MASVKVTDLRQSLRAFLAQVKRGERLEITVRGKVIAQIVAPAIPPAGTRLARGGLRGSVLRYDDPLAPAIDPGEWEMSR
jgi:antitoxin (DNA-binding transcriptional repressor) of toxin-antitoxin stability system